MTRRPLGWVWALLVGGCGEDPAPIEPARDCGGYADYCERPYNEVSQVCTHNAMSNVVDGFVFPTPNQTQGLTRQLDDGVRCLMLDTYWHEGEASLCHGACGIWGVRPLQDGLVEVREWLESHPTDILTFILEAYLDEAQTRQALTAAGLDPFLYRHAGIGTPWPTYGEMIDANERLVVFTDDADSTEAWHLDWRTHGWETPFNDESFSCVPGRGDPTAAEHPIFILNHYTLCGGGGCPENALVNNALDGLLERAFACSETEMSHNPFGQIPTFVNVDHYDVPRSGGDPEVADVFEAVEALNER
jgi:hypothetical protein